MKRITKSACLIAIVPVLALVLMSFNTRETKSYSLEMETVMYPGLEVLLQWDASQKQLLFTGSGQSQGLFSITVRNLSQETIWQGTVKDAHAVVYPINLSTYSEDIFIVEVDNGEHATTSMIMSPDLK